MTKRQPIKTYVLDTNVLMTSPYAIYAFDEHNVIIMDITLEELDRLKSLPGERGANARETIRILDALQKLGSLIQGINLPGGGNFRIATRSVITMTTSANGYATSADNIILQYCADNKNTCKNLVLVTNDINMRIKAEVRGISAEAFKTDQAASLHEQYTGRCKVTVTSNGIANFYSAHEMSPEEVIDVEGDHDYQFTVNEFALLIDECNLKHTAIARYDGSKFIPLLYDNAKPYGVRPRNVGQKFAQEALMTSVEKAPLVILKGPAGTAKTFYSLAVGLEKTLGKETSFDRILVARPNIKFDEDIGYLKGTEEEKIGPLIRPIFDNLEQLTKTNCERKDGVGEKSYAQDLFDRSIITAQALAYMRGRSIADTWIVIDEAQNMTPTQAFGIISRCGAGSKIILAGDPEQIDNPHLDARTNGLSYASERMRGSPLCWQITFDDEECVRSALALEAIQRMPPKGMTTQG